MRARTLSSVKEIDAAEWNAIVPENRLICRHEYLAAVEESRVNDCRHFYPVVREGNEIVAHACLYFISTELDSFARGWVKKAINCVRKVWKGFLILRSVECGTPTALGNTISFREGSERAGALALIVGETERLARSLGVKVVLFRDFYDEDTELYDALREKGYARILNLPGNRLRIRWKSFEEYLGAMRSEYRNRIARRMRKFRSSGGTHEIMPRFSFVSSDLERLWRNAYDHATEYRREILSADFFRNIDKGLGERSFVLLSRVNGRSAGFSLLCDDDDTLIWLFCGLDYACNERSAVYFNMLYKIVELAIEGGFKAIDLGLTTVLPKMDIGGETINLHMYMRHFNPVLGRLAPLAFRLMTPRPPSEVRRVFRGESERQASRDPGKDIAPTFKDRPAREAAIA